MCGILGQFNYSSKISVDSEKFKESLNILHHRGPDDSGIWEEKASKIALGHKRLSIIDLDSGHQPMLDASLQYVITFNGEIYNYQELKSELIKKGYKFRTNSDTEVILNCYSEYGIDGFNKLNGIFAFGIFDINKKELIIARDRFGVKPLYYINDNGKFAFSSEIKSLLKLNLIPKDINIEELNINIQYRFSPSPATIFNGIKKINGGDYLKIDLNNNITLKSFLNSRIETDEKISFSEAKEKYKILLNQAVKRQMISDVPIGVLLSGGIDSALLTKMMQDNSSERIASYTIAFEGNGDFNELKAARETSEILGTNYNEYILTYPEFVEYFEHSFMSLEEPIAITSATSLYLICNFISKNLKVAISGQGADELWAGYNRYKAEYVYEKIKYILKILPVKYLEKFIRNNEIKRFINAISIDENKKRLDSIISVFNYENLRQLIKTEYYTSERNHSRVSELYNMAEGFSNTLQKLLFIDMRMNLSDCLLLLADKLSMANSLELRVPYLDNDLVDFVETLPIKYKINIFTQKYLHKQMAKEYLPSQIINRRKIGFETPMNLWMKNEISDYLIDLINCDNSMTNIYFNKKYVLQLIDEHKKNRCNNERKLFIILTLEKWYQEFYNKY